MMLTRRSLASLLGLFIPWGRGAEASTPDSKPGDEGASPSGPATVPELKCGICGRTDWEQDTFPLYTADGWQLPPAKKEVLYLHHFDLATERHHIHAIDIGGPCESSWDMGDGWVRCVRERGHAQPHRASDTFYKGVPWIWDKK